MPEIWSNESTPLSELEGVDGVKFDKHNGSGWQVSTPSGYSDNFDPLLTMRGGEKVKKKKTLGIIQENRETGTGKKNVRTHKTNKSVLTAGDERR